MESDRTRIIGFCANTFGWGDYIADVWDIWYREKDANLFVAELQNEPVGMAHAAMCPSGTGAWLEGLRVHPDFRRAGIASRLLNEMLSYAEKEGARQVLAIVSRENGPSRNMLEHSGFVSISEWSYFSGNKELVGRMRPGNARYASKDDLEEVCSYLESSEIFEKSARRYVQSWRWYELDRGSLERLIAQRAIIVTGNPVNGLSVLNTAGYWNRKGVLQVVYMDSLSEESIGDMLSFVNNLLATGAFERLQILCHQSLGLHARLEVEETENFLVYRKKLLPAQ